jgi:TRAP-type C4-dicarboxylate transport system substrate-binding protein
MNADKWNALNETEQGWIKEAALVARSACYEYNQSQEQACFDSFDEKGITLLEVTDIEKWQDACSSLYAEQSDEIQDIVSRIQSGNY